MRTHRIIFWITLILFVVFIPIVLILNIEDNIKNILIGITCSSLVSSIVELPNLLNYKFSIKSNIYNGLFYAKLFLLQYNENIEERLKENKFTFNNYSVYYLQNICNNINLFNQSDETIFYHIDSRKKVQLNSKIDFHKLYNDMKIESINLDIIKTKMDLGECTIKDLHSQLNIIKETNNEFIKKIDYVAEKILSKKYRKYYEDNSSKILEALKNETR